MKKSLVLLLVFLAAFFVTRPSASQDSTPFKKKGNVPNAGFVPNEKTAIAVGFAILTPIYGEKQLNKEKPFHAILQDDVWMVYGTLPKEAIGGTAIIKISKADGHVLDAYHEK